MKILITDKIKENFFKRINKTDYCWNWIGSKNKSGYGLFILGKRVTGFQKSLRVKAHRFSFYLHYGYIDENLLTCHKCDNPSCVNPEHIFLGTHLDNYNDCEKKKRRIYQKMEFCKNGHPRIDENIIKNKNRTICIICRNKYAKDKHERLKNDKIRYAKRNEYRRIWSNNKRRNNEKFRDEINAKAREVNRNIKNNMSADEYKKYREDINKKAREAYLRRKNAIKSRSSSK